MSDTRRPLITSGTAPQDECALRPTSCVARHHATTLREAGLRPTRQRIGLANLIFGKGDRHVCADLIGYEASLLRLHVSMATIYNTLHQFRDAGLLRAVVLDGTKLWFDTNTSDHHHFYCEQDGELKDIPAGSLSLGALPPPPPGMEIAGVEATVRLRPRRRG